MAVGAEEFRKFPDPPRRGALPHGRDQDNHGSNVNLSAEEPHRRRRRPLAATVPRTAETEPAAVFLGEIIVSFSGPCLDTCLDKVDNARLDYDNVESLYRNSTKFLFGPTRFIMGMFTWLFAKNEIPKGSGATPTGTTKFGDQEPAKDRRKEPAAVAPAIQAADAAPEVIRIGAFGGRIVSITQQRIEYIDMAGEVQFVDLDECAKNWGRSYDDHSHEFSLLPGASEQSVAEWNVHCVGQRGALDDPPWAEFTNARKTRFEFESHEALYAELLGPLMKAGWHTFDTC